MTRYELATLDFRNGSSAAVTAGLDAFVHVPDAKGKVIGCWTSEIGPLNWTLLLRAFEGGQ